jgi:hypothetical protein
LKDIASNVSKEAVAAKAENAPTLAEKVEEGSKDVAKDIAVGVESAGKEIEAHPELIAEYVPFPKKSQRLLVNLYETEEQLLQLLVWLVLLPRNWQLEESR